MLKKYKNGFIEIIKKHGLDPAEFSILESKSEQGGSKVLIVPDITTIRLRNTGLKFDIFETATALHTFGVNYTRFDADWPSNWLRGPGSHPSVRHSIDEIYRLYNRWLSAEVEPYIQETQQPDLWQQIEQQRQLITARSLTPYEVSPFTEEEKPQLRASIQQFRLLVCESFNTTQEQLKCIDERVDYLTQAVDRLNRFDWKGLALSIVVGISIDLCVDTDGGRRLFELFKQAFNGVLHLLQ